MRRDENLLAAVEAGAERDKQILAALNRDDSFKKNVKNIADTLEKKLQHGAARRDKRKNLKDFEVKLDYMEKDSFARGGQAVVKLGEDLCGNQPVCRVHAADLARSSGEEPASPRNRAGVASMAWRTTR